MKRDTINTDDRDLYSLLPVELYPSFTPFYNRQADDFIRLFTLRRVSKQFQHIYDTLLGEIRELGQNVINIMTDDALRHTKSLSKLDLSWNNGITMYSVVKFLPTLKSIVLGEDNALNIRPLAGLSSLRSLVIKGSQEGKYAYETNLCLLTQLESLDIRECLLRSTDSLSRLTNLTNLVHDIFSDDKVKLPLILTRLTNLSLSYNVEIVRPVFDWSMDFNSLTILNVRAFGPMYSHPLPSTLKRLSLKLMRARPASTDFNCDYLLRDLTNLVHLNIGSFPAAFTDKALFSLSSLKVLKLSVCPSITDVGLGYVATRLERLQLYAVSDQITDYSLCTMHKLTRLRLLDMPRMGSDWCLSSLSNLQQLIYSSCGISNNGLKLLTNLTHLNIGTNDGTISHQSMSHLTKLVHLRIESPVYLIELALLNMPFLSSLHLEGAIDFVMIGYNSRLVHIGLFRCSVKNESSIVDLSCLERFDFPSGSIFCDGEALELTDTLRRRGVVVNGKI